MKTSWNQVEKGPKRNEGTDTIREKGTVGDSSLDEGVKSRNIEVELRERLGWRSIALSRASGGRHVFSGFEPGVLGQFGHG
jgi:hypothetical protein